jgi:hypothetical protein
MNASIMATTPAHTSEQASTSNTYSNLAAVIRDSKSLFACSGELAVDEAPSAEQPATGRLATANPASSAPVVLRWDSPDGAAKEANKLVLPLHLDSSGSADLAKLVSHVQPATFGRDDKDVYDETYRRAGKMDTHLFCSTFNPYELGIVDTIAQLLLPSKCGSRDNSCGLSLTVRP